MTNPVDLHSYVDGELTAESSSNIETMLTNNSADMREVEAIRNLKELLRTKSQQFGSEQAWQQCRTRLTEIDRSKRVDLFVGRFAPILCGVLFACILIAGAGGKKHSVENLTGLHLSKLFGSASSTVHPNSSWLSGLIRQSHLSTPDKLQIRGVSEGFIDNVRVRKFAVRDADGDFAIMVIPQGMEFEGMTPVEGHPNLKSMRLNGMNFVSRNDDTDTVVAIADRSDSDLAAVLALVKITSER